MTRVEMVEGENFEGWLVAQILRIEPILERYNGEGLRGSGGMLDFRINMTRRSYRDGKRICRRWIIRALVSAILSGEGMGINIDDENRVLDNGVTWMKVLGDV